MTSAPRHVPRPASVLRDVLPPMLFMLLCGVVGPIFLAMSFVIDDPGTGWLLPTGVGITAVDLIVGALIGRGRYRSRQKTHRLRSRGRTARAQVLSYDETGVQINNQPLMKLRLLIDGENLSPFEVEGSIVVSYARRPLLHDGELPVWVDPETREWEIDWAVAKPMTPTARIGVSAETGGPVETRSSAERLAELDDLLRRDLLSREEYDAARARILGAL